MVLCSLNLFSILPTSLCSLNTFKFTNTVPSSALNTFRCTNTAPSSALNTFRCNYTHPNQLQWCYTSSFCDKLITNCLIIYEQSQKHFIFKQISTWSHTSVRIWESTCKQLKLTNDIYYTIQVWLQRHLPRADRCTGHGKVPPSPLPWFPH